MQHLNYCGTAEDWLARNIEIAFPVKKATADTRAWRGRSSSAGVFVKHFPDSLGSSRVSVEKAIAGGGLDTAIVPLRSCIACTDGTLMIYDNVAGENLGESASRDRFARLTTHERITAVLSVCRAIAAVYSAGFMVVDWYEGNMIYDFGAKKVHLFDWELCVPTRSFDLEMDSNYGSSRLMAPEEFVRGMPLDGRTLVFNLGRYTLLALPELAEALDPLVTRACRPSRAARYETPAEYYSALASELSQARQG